MGVEKIQELDAAISAQLNDVRDYSARRKLFDERLMTGSKLGDTCPKKNVWIICEASELTSNFQTPLVDEVTKFVNTAVLESCEGFNMAVFGGGEEGTWIPWSAQYQDPSDAKKGAAD